MHKHDAPATLHYVDPPYLAETRAKQGDGGARHRYRHELTDDDHAALLDVLRGLSGFVVLSGYPSRLYDDMLADWWRVERKARADGARQRTEVLWINPRGHDTLSFDRMSAQAALFAEAEVPA